MAMTNTPDGQEAMLRLWTPKRIAEAFAKVARPDGTVGEEEIMFVIQGIIEEYEFTHEQDEAARQQDKATIADLQADLEAVTQDAMTQNNEVVRLTDAPVMTDVWCVFLVEEHEGSFLEAIFSTEAEAEACAEHLRQVSKEYWDKVEEDVLEPYEPSKYYNVYAVASWPLFGTLTECQQRPQSTT
jgi:hypothetical protein